MAAFVFAPIPKGKIPKITVEELATALRAFLPTVYEFDYQAEDLEGSRQGLMEEIVFYGSKRGEPAERMKLRVSFLKSVQSWESKLYNIPFNIGISEGGNLTEEERQLPIERRLEIFRSRRREFLIEPRPDRSIAIHYILRWEHGIPVLEE